MTMDGKIVELKAMQEKILAHIVSLMVFIAVERTIKEFCALITPGNLLENAVNLLELKERAKQLAMSEDVRVIF